MTGGEKSMIETIAVILGGVAAAVAIYEYVKNKNATAQAAASSLPLNAASYASQYVPPSLPSITLPSTTFNIPAPQAPLSFNNTVAASGNNTSNSSTPCTACMTSSVFGSSYSA